MNDSCLAVEKALRELVQEKPYKSISVSDICERACLSRKSFYTNYHTKEDVVSQIVTKDIVSPLRSINALFSRSQSRDMYHVISQKIYEKPYEDQAFYRALVGPMKGVDDTFLRVVTNAIYDFNMELLSGSKAMKRDERKMDYVAYFFASSQAMLMQKWIYDGFVYTPDELANLYDEMTQSYWLTTYDGVLPR